MTHTIGEVTTNMVDLTGLSLAELRANDDPALLRSLTMVVKRIECGSTGVLQNQVRDEA